LLSLFKIDSSSDSSPFKLTEPLAGAMKWKREILEDHPRNERNHSKDQRSANELGELGETH